jgi:hypothetical protein
MVPPHVEKALKEILSKRDDNDIPNALRD